ncbi:hypothetical protein FRC00_006620, partial [Tulasnella sp. 408]
KPAGQPSPDRTSPANNSVAPLPSKITSGCPPNTAAVSSPPTSPASFPEAGSPNRNPTLPTPQTWRKDDLQKRDEARAEAYLKLTGDFWRSGTAEQLTKEEIQARDVTRASAYFRLAGVFGPVTAGKSKEEELEVRLRARAEFRRWGAAEQAAERDIEEREQARVESYWRLTGEVQ